jgi:hypothetical protein
MTWYAGNNSTNNGSLGWRFEAAPGGAVNLTGDDITTDQPTVGASDLAQEHDLAANGLTTGSPIIPSSTIDQTHVLAPNAITTGHPVVGTSDIAQEHNLTLTAIRLVSLSLVKPLRLRQRACLLMGLPRVNL